MSFTKLLGIAGADSEIRGATLDNADNLYVCGDTAGNLDGQTLTGTTDLFLAKYNNAGEFSLIFSLVFLNRSVCCC